VLSSFMCSNKSSRKHLVRGQSLIHCLFFKILQFRKSKVLEEYDVVIQHQAASAGILEECIAWKRFNFVQRLEDETPSSLVLSLPLQQDGFHGFIEHRLQILSGFCAALKILFSLDFPRQILTLFWS